MQNMTRDRNGTVFKENARPVIENVSTVLHIHTLYYHTRKRNSKLCIAIQTRSKLHRDKADLSGSWDVCFVLTKQWDFMGLIVIPPKTLLLK
jgi:hypothetical protein